MNQKVFVKPPVVTGHDLSLSDRNLPLQVIRDYYELCKPRVVALMLLTVWVGMFLAPSTTGVSWQIFLWATIGIGLTAGAAAAINHLVDQKVDSVMHRTRRRPIPTGRVRSQQAIIFSFLIGSVGFFILWRYVNPLTAWLTAASLVGYAFFYTLYLKRATPQNIVIGGLAGAMPPLLGWTAVTGAFDAHALLLVMIIFVWTPPHFWALALHRLEDYKKAGIPMLPVTHGVAYTKLQILLYTALLCISTVLPFVVRMSGWLYLSGVLVLNAVFLYHVIVLWRASDVSSAFRIFKYSIVYLMLLFTLLLVDHYL